jgi:hypothetical protein
VTAKTLALLATLSAPAALSLSSPSALAGPAPRTSATVGPNVDVSVNPTRIHSTGMIGIDRANPLRLIAACNQINANPQMLFASGDGGASWTGVEMGLGSATYHSDPGIAWDSQGNGYVSALGIQCLDPSCSDSLVEVQLARTTDGGQTWSPPSSVHVAAGNSKELVAANHQAAAPCADLVCLAWTETTATQDDIRVACSPGGGGPWTSQVIASGPFLIGATPAFGPNGEVYVIWHDARVGQPNQSGFGVSRSLDCGGTWSPIRRFGPTRAYFDLAIPAMCDRRALIYPSMDIDRSTGPRRGQLYAAWTDAAPGATCPDYTLPCAGCPASACVTGCSSEVYFASSSDGGQNWSAPAIVHANLAMTDQFNPSLAVNDLDGTIHVAWNDTRDDPTRLATHIYHVSSPDGGLTWSPETQVTSAPTDETPVASGAADGNQYGDYRGIAVHACRAFPAWTDRRTGNLEQIYTAEVTTGTGCCSGTVPADLGNTLRGIKNATLEPELSWTDLGADESDYAVYRGASPDFVTIPPARIGTSGGPDVVRYADTTSPAVPGCSFYKVRGLGACNEELPTW